MPDERAIATLGKMLGGITDRVDGSQFSKTHVRSKTWLAADSTASDSRTGITVAIEGTPRFISSRYLKIMAEQSAAAAVLHAYADWGPDVVCEMRGTYSLAIWNARDESLMLAIDRMGVRPLCYARHPDSGLIFGTTTDSVLMGGASEASYSPQAIYDYIYFHVIPSPTTIYDGVSKLEPAQRLIFRNGGVKTDIYWKPKFAQRGDTLDSGASDELEQQIKRAVEACAVNNNTGAFLSGGLDSSTVCGYANDLVERRLPAFSIGFDQEGYDEIAFAECTASHFDLDLVPYYVTADDVADSVATIAAAYDEPFGNSSAIPALFCARLAKSHGVDKLLAGDGGDELFAGNERYERQLVFEHYRRIPAPVRSALLEPLGKMIPAREGTLPYKAKRYIEQARVAMPERLQTYNFLHLTSAEDVFDPGFLDQVDPDGPLTGMCSWYDDELDADIVDKMLLFDWKLTLADNDLRKVNRMCEIAGIDVCYPLLDDDLVEFSTTIPPQFKLKRGDLRHFFRTSLSHYLPPQVLAKKKHGFGLPFGEWLITSESLKDVVFPSIDRIRSHGIFKPEFIDGLLHDHEHAHAAFYGNIIWVITFLEHWLSSRAVKK